MYVEADDPRLLPIALRSELLAAGESDRSLARALRAGTLVRPRRGAYVDGHSWCAMSEEEMYAVRCRAAYRQARAEVFLSHVSALPLLDGPLWGFDLTEAHLTRLDGRAGRREAGVRQHCGDVAEGDFLSAYGIQISTPLRATLEATTSGSAEAALGVANHFLHRGDFTKDQLRERYGSIAGWPFSLKTDVVIRLADERIESLGESRTFYFLWRYGFPAPVPQYEVFDNGVLVARLDFAYPDLKVWIEFDGRVKYQPRRGPDDQEDQRDATTIVLREKRREERVAELTGWRCLRITWTDLAYPERLAARLQRLIDSMSTTARRTR